MTTQLETKRFSGIKADGDRAFSAVVSTSLVDADGDIVLPSAFEAGVAVPLLVAHDWSRLPVGKGTVHPGQSDVRMHAEFFETSAGREAAATLKALGPLAEFSVGFQTLDHTFREVDARRVRVVEKLRLYEVSLVVAGSARGTRLLGARNATGDDASKRELLRMWRDLAALDLKDLEREVALAEEAKAIFRRHGLSG